MLCTWRVGLSYARKPPSRSVDLYAFIRLFAWTAVFAIPAVAQCAEVNLQWAPVLSEPSVAGYEVHYGLASGQYQWVAEANENGAATSSEIVEGLEEGATYYFAVRSRNHDASLVSAFSDEVSVRIESPLRARPVASAGTQSEGVTLDSTGSESAVGAANSVPQASDPRAITSFRDSPLPIEVGEIALDQEWRRFEFRRPFSDPIVIVRPLSGNGADPALVRVDKIDGSGFSARVQEWDYLDGIRDRENVSYMVVEGGRHQLPDGAWIEADWLEVDDAFVVVDLAAPFTSRPVVLTTVSSENETDAVTTRVRGIDEFQFEVKLQEQQASSGDHIPERVAYVAWEPSAGEIEGILYEVGRTEDRVTHELHTIDFSVAFDPPPIFLADMQTTNCVDTASLRSLSKGYGAAAVWVDEESSEDWETDHNTEVVGYIAFGRPKAKLAIEAGEIEVEQAWKRVDFRRVFSDPVVVVGSLSGYDSDSVVVRVDAVDRKGFWIRLQERGDLDNSDVVATVDFVVMERGRHRLPNGAWVEANLIETEATDAFGHVAFAGPFSETPAVATSVTTAHDPVAVAAHVRAVDQDGFEILLEERETGSRNHAVEKIAYIAWEPFSGELDGLDIDIGRTDE